MYSRKDLPSAKVPLRGDEPRERARGPLATEDAREYAAVHVRAGQIAGVPAGKYLVDESGAIRYLVDPGINGRLSRQDDGTPVQKYDAPKATLMAFIIDGILSQQMPWSLVLLGVAIALVLELAGIPSLPFAVGVYLPLSASTPIFAGGIVRWVVDRWLRDGRPESEMSPGILLASGLIAGGTIAGIVAAILSLFYPGMTRIGAALFGAASESSAVAMVPFGLLVLVLLLVGGELLAGRRAPVNAAAGPRAGEG